MSEILALKWSDFDLEEGTLMITRGTVHAPIGRVKTEYSEDEMPLHPAFAEILLSWRARCPESEEGWVFHIPNTGFDDQVARAIPRMRIPLAEGDPH